jgi:hypothetical protein
LPWVSHRSAHVCHASGSAGQVPSSDSGGEDRDSPGRSKPKVPLGRMRAWEVAVRAAAILGVVGSLVAYGVLQVCCCAGNTDLGSKDGSRLQRRVCVRACAHACACTCACVRIYVCVCLCVVCVRAPEGTCRVCSRAPAHRPRAKPTCRGSVGPSTAGAHHDDAIWHRRQSGGVSIQPLPCQLQPARRGAGGGRHAPGAQRVAGLFELGRAGHRSMLVGSVIQEYRQSSQQR